MAKYGRGLICLTLTDDRCRQLGLKQMVSDNQTPHAPRSPSRSRPPKA